MEKKSAVVRGLLVVYAFQFYYFSTFFFYLLCVFYSVLLDLDLTLLYILFFNLINILWESNLYACLQAYLLKHYR